MRNNNKSYFTTKSKVFAYSIQFITDKQFYRFTNENKEVVYSFEIDISEKESFYNKLNKLEEIKFS